MSISWITLLPVPVKRLLQDRPVVQKFLGNSAWQVGDRVVRTGAGVLVNVYVARYLGPGDFGLINFALALTALFSAIAAFGLPSIVVRDLVNRPQERPTILASALVLRLIGGTGSVILAASAMLFLRAGDHRSQLIVFIVALTNVPLAWDIIDYDYQSRMDAGPIVIARNVAFILTAALRVALVLVGAPLAWFAWVMSLETAVAAWLMARRARLDGLSIPIRAASWRELRHLAAICWPLIIAGVSISVYMRVDQVMLGQMLGDVGVGLFSAAARVSEALYFLPMAVATSVAPALTATYRRSTREYERRFLQVTRVLVWIALAFALTFAVFSRLIISVLYGPKYSDAAAVLAVHAWAGVLVSLGVCSQLWLTNAGYFKFSMYQTLMGAAVNVALNLALIPRFGILGAAFATVAGQVASVMLSVALDRRTRGLFRLQLAALLPVF